MAIHIIENLRTFQYYCLMSIITPVIQLLGSLAFLLYGMKLMSDGVQKSAGEKLQRALSVITGNRFVALLTGLIVTMIIQSSGATTVMVVTFVNAHSTARHGARLAGLEGDVGAEGRDGNQEGMRTPRRM